MSTEIDRRSFMTALFAGAMFGVPPTVQVYFEHEHYTTREGLFNIWYYQDNFWYLWSDSHRAPYEFQSRSDAMTHAEKAGFQFANTDKVKPVREGDVLVKPAPTVIHPMHFLRQSPAEIEAFFNEHQIWDVDPLPQRITSDLLAAANGFEQCDIWVKALDIAQEKKARGDFSDQRKILELQYNDGFRQLIKSVFFIPDTYHSVLAKIRAFTVYT